MCSLTSAKRPWWTQLAWQSHLGAHRQQTGSESAAYVNIGHALAVVKKLAEQFFTLLRARERATVTVLAETPHGVRLEP
jgi:hypothetical protein